MGEREILGHLADQLDVRGFAYRDYIDDWITNGPSSGFSSVKDLLASLRGEIWRDFKNVGDLPDEWRERHPRPYRSDFDNWAAYNKAENEWRWAADAVAKAPYHDAEAEIIAAGQVIGGERASERDYPSSPEHIGTGDEACPIVRASEMTGADIDRLKVRTVFVTGAGVKKRNLPLVKGPGDAAQAIADEWGDSDREVLAVLLLNNRHHVVGVHESAVGSVNGVEVHPRETFKAAVVAGATAIIIAHIHPSGDPTPSAQDIELTARLKRVGEEIGIAVLDHIVIGEDSWQSLNGERGSLAPSPTR